MCVRTSHHNCIERAGGDGWAGESVWNAKIMFQVKTYITGFVIVTRAQTGEVTMSDFSRRKVVAETLVTWSTPAPAKSRRKVVGDTLVSCSTPALPTASPPTPEMTSQTQNPLTATVTPLIVTAVIPDTTPESRFSSAVQVEWSRPLVVRIRNDGFNIVVPRIGQRRRSYITFSKSWPCGASADFGMYITSELRRVSKTWKSEVELLSWLTKQLTWKSKVTTNWVKKVKRLNYHERVRADRRAVNVAAAMLVQTSSGAKRHVVLRNPLVFRGHKCTHVVRLPDFMELKSKMARNGEVQAIRIISREASRKHKAAGYLYLPATLVGNNKGAEYTLGVRYGSNKDWIRFVWEYVSYAVSKWKTFDDARSWVTKQRKTFITIMQQLWEFEGDKDKVAGRVWRIGPSQVKPNLKYVKEKRFPAEAVTDSGFGLFCVKENADLTLWCDGPVSATSRKDDPPNGLEVYYMVSIAGSDVIVVPTPKAFACWAIHHPFLVQHSEDNPTHTACSKKNDMGKWYPCLTQHRPVSVGEEYTFNYGKDDATAHNIRRALDIDASACAGLSK